MPPGSTRPCCRSSRPRPWSSRRRGSRTSPPASSRSPRLGSPRPGRGGPKATAPRPITWPVRRAPASSRRAALDTARRLEALPETSAATRRGELSVEQTSAIVGAACVDPAAERKLLEAATRSPLAELHEQCARTKATALTDPEVRRARIHQRRSLRSYTDAEGEWHLHCQNNPEVGARIMAALDPFHEAIFRQARSEGRREAPAAYAADALAEMARCSHDGIADREPATAGAEVAADPGDDSGTDATPEAAGPAVAAAKLGPPPAPPRRSRSSGPPKIIVRVDLGALLRGWPTEGEVCEIAGFGPVAVSAVRDMIDADDPFLAALATRGQKVLGVAQRLAADRPAVALPELRQRGVQRSGQARLRAPPRLG